MKKKAFILLSSIMFILSMLTAACGSKDEPLFSNHPEPEPPFSIVSSSCEIQPKSYLSFDLLLSQVASSLVSFSYDSISNTFYQKDEYEYTVIGYAKTKELEEFLNNNLVEYKRKYGQINIFTEIDGVEILVFNGWQLGKAGAGLIEYTIFIGDDKNEKYAINTSDEFIPSNILLHEAEYYLLGHAQHITDPQTRQTITTLFLFNIHTGDKQPVLSTRNLINIRHMTTSGSLVFINYIDDRGIDYLISYDLRKGEITRKLNLSDIMKERYPNPMRILLLNDMLLCFNQNASGKIVFLRITSELELVEHVYLDTPSFYMLRDVFEYDDSIYILTELGDGVAGALSLFDISTGEMSTLIEFETINNNENMFVVGIRDFSITGE